MKRTLPLEPRCKFCGCGDRTPCLIPASFISDPDFRPDRNAVFCAWLLPDVCSAPPCVAKTYFEARAKAEQIDRELHGDSPIFLAQPEELAELLGRAG